MRPDLWLAAVVLLAVLLVNAETSAQSCHDIPDTALATRPVDQRDPGAASALFDEAKQLEAADQWDEACPRYRASWDLDPSVGTLLNIAKCHEHCGWLATALGDYERARVMNRTTQQPERREQIDAYIETRTEDLSKRVPRLRITVDPQPEGLVVTRDGERMPISALGLALPIDPGELLIEVKAPGWRDAQKKVQVLEGQSSDIVLALAKDQPLPPPPTVVPKPPPPLAHDTPPPSGTPPSDAPSSEVPTWAWVSGSVGAAMSLVAIGFAIDYSLAAGELRDACPEFECSGSTTLETQVQKLNDRKNRDLGLGVGLGVGGGVALGAALVGVLVFSSPEPNVGVTVDHRGATLTLGGRF